MVDRSRFMGVKNQQGEIEGEPPLPNFTGVLWTNPTKTITFWFPWPSPTTWYIQKKYITGIFGGLIGGTGGMQHDATNKHVDWTGFHGKSMGMPLMWMLGMKSWLNHVTSARFQAVDSRTCKRRTSSNICGFDLGKRLWTMISQWVPWTGCNKGILSMLKASRKTHGYTWAEPILLSVRSPDENIFQWNTLCQTHPKKTACM